MLTIKCVKCKRKIFRYLKLGKGRVLHCWKSRIDKDYSIHEGNKVFCKCGNLIGVEGQKWIKLRQASFFHTGTKE
ncbi:hypothetical protein AMJ74_03600 [candidate division WOR_3 bacterium SM1_77]|jgi:hypothetical protein|uniref:Uncharacterized protein n=1 Tax=candidate division WOR_3 bacterium SM1_77 TaxID=1703778 RepID=A0A0S8JX39_UNCW3|nr:MAG: hypothetical protein AMJ74_03600 [candidate division WOR_3 bacterium SM1_77]